MPTPITHLAEPTFFCAGDCPYNKDESELFWASGKQDPEGDWYCDSCIDFHALNKGDCLADHMQYGFKKVQESESG